MSGTWTTPYPPGGSGRVDSGAVTALLRQPGVLIGSARASRAYDRRAMLRFPVRATRRSRLCRRPGSVVNLGGHLFLGHWPDTDDVDSGGRVGPAADAPAVVEVGEGGTFTTGGWVVVGAGSEIVVGPGASVHIGGGSYCNVGVRILCSNSIHIGEDCAISWGVQILDDDLHALSIGGVAKPRSGQVRVGNHVWMGIRSTVVKGVSIGDGAILAAGAVVTGDVAPRSLVGGVPARVLASDVDWW